jgi:Tol biopolymer transport system component
MSQKLRWKMGVMMFALIWLATACLPEGMRLPQSEFLSVVERKSGLIAYLGIDGNIYTIDQGGGEPTPVTTDADIDGDYSFYDVPIWSRNNEWLAFAQYQGEEGNPPTTTSLYIARKDGSSLTQAYSSEDYIVYYYWAPDSQRVSFISSTANQNLALKLVSTSGGEAETVDIGSPFYWTWAPDSHSVLIHTGEAADGRLALLQLGETVTEHGLGIKPSMFRAPAYSPDGRQVLVAGESAEGKSALLLTDTTGSNPQTLAEYSGNIAFAWSPDGKRIAYTASDGRGSEGLRGPLTIVDPSGNKEPLTLKDELVYAFFWSPDSKSIAYFSTREILPPTPESGEASDEAPQTVWGLRVMDARNGKSHEVLEHIAPTDQFFQLVPYFDQYHHSATIWSPDSKNLVLSTYYSRSEPPGIFVVAASGKLDPRFIANGLAGVWSWK